MNREIKFRGIGSNDKQWVYGFYAQAKGQRATFHYICSGPADIGVRVDPLTVGQFTGMVSEDGKEIYEGDILEAESDKRVGAVVFRSGCFWFKSGPNYGELHYTPYMSILGNTYENPELLEKQDAPSS